MSNAKERPPGKTTGRKYDCVAALMRGEGMASEVQAKVEKHALQTRLSLHLAKMRQAAGLTQEEMGAALNVGQSAISKLEAGTDDNVTVHHVQEYSRVTQTRVSLMFGKPISDMEAIVMYVDALRDRLVRLAESANQNEDTEDKVKAFLGEASTNILKAVALCNCKLPVKLNDDVQEIRIEIVTGKKVMPINDTPMVKKAMLREVIS